MASLERSLRKELERVVKKARKVAEAGARQAIAQLGVGDADAPKHLTAEHRALRNRLRAHGRQLGDRREPKTGAQATARLAQESAYEHWHRMLFARFLGENDLLIEPESGVAIALDEIQELARDKGADWLLLASDYAERMLPQIFRKDDPVLDIALPPETRSELEDLLKALPKAVFEADDSLGWVYQFWQAEKKEEVNNSELKIGADELPAVTQLFTEDYMVLFLLHNTLGAWWAGKVLAGNPALAGSASSEEALRAACRVGDVDWTYLRFVREEAEDGSEGPWRPAAGKFEGWPKAAKDITVLDPCMGSGHFLVFALPILVAVRMAEEGLSERDAVGAVLRENLFGLEIDPRCTQIAAFNLAFAAWKRTGFHVLPQLNLACSGLAVGVTKAEWLKLAEKAVTSVDPAAKRDLLGVEKNLLTVGLEERVKNGLEALYDLFAKAPWLGSLIDPRRAGADIFREGFDKLEPLLASILVAADTDDAREMVVAAQGMAKAAEVLHGKFVLTITNVPYLQRSSQHQIIANYISDFFDDGKTDLATAFVLRLKRWADSKSVVAAVTPENWQYQDQYRRFRDRLSKSLPLTQTVRLGPGAFAEIGGEVVKPALNIWVEGPNPLGMSLHDIREIESKSDALRQRSFAALRIPLGTKHNAILFDHSSSVPSLLSDYAVFSNGVQSGDQSRFGRKFWEIATLGARWSAQQTTVEATVAYGGRTNIFLWDDGRGEFYEFVCERLGTTNPGAWIRGEAVWGKKGVLVSAMGALNVSLFDGNLFDDNCVAIVPNDPDDLGAIWAFCSSPDYYREVRRIDTSLKVRGPLLRVPFDLAHWRAAAARNTSITTPATNDPLQWIFSGYPGASSSPLHVAVARTCSYRWPRQTGSSFLDCPAIPSGGLETHADADGIVCLTALKGEPPAEQRLNALLADASGIEWSAAKLASLLVDAGYAGKSLDDWLRDGFFEQHSELFHQRPFVWHIWDGRRDGFHALVNYHRLAAPNGEGRRTLERLIYSYLGDWIDRQRDQQKAGAEGADARLAHAEHLRAELNKILEGEPPYDIFVRWKPLHKQPIGWDPDINDGVRMNIRPFMTAKPLGAKAKGACILRATPRIKWDKDRGKEPNREKVDYPWFWGWDEATADFAGGATFDGNRWNDMHYSRDVKQTARDRHAAKTRAKP